VIAEMMAIQMGAGAIVIVGGFIWALYDAKKFE
jgi:hypothetical protein